MTETGRIFRKRTDSVNGSQVVAAMIGRKLASLVQPNGRFFYRIDHGGMPAAKGDYNVLRHAAAVWILRQGEKEGLLGLEAAAGRASAFLREEFIRPAPWGRCVVEGGVVKLGGVALAVLALLDEPPDFWNPAVDLASALINYIENQICDGRAFIHKRYAATWEVIPFESQYYTGEALFAWIRFYAVRSPNRLPSNLIHLIHELDAVNYGVEQQSHWMLYALSALHSLCPEQWVVRYQEKIVGDILQRDHYRRRGSTPIACRSEGLLCYLRPEQQRIQSRQELRKAAVLALRENLRLQAAFIDPDGMVWRDETKSDTRIDHLQHSMACFLDSYDVIRDA